MYKLMVVDDEVAVRDALVELIDLDSLGFSLVGLASNGLEALDCFDEDDVEVLITDINMPFLDGLELVSEIRKRGSDCRVIFLTGYDEFEYAKEAVALGVEKYILKPITKKEITELLSEIKSDLDEKYNQKEQIKNLQLKYEKNKKVFAERSLIGILEGEIPKSMMLDSINEFGRDIKKGVSFSSCVIEIKDFKDIVKNDFDLNYYRFFYTLIEFCKKDLEKKGDFILLKASKNTIVVLCLEIREESNLQPVFTQLIRNINLTFSVNATVGIGNVRGDVFGLKDSYDEALVSLENNLIDSSNRVIIYRESNNLENVDEKLLQAGIARVIDSIKIGDEKSKISNIDIFFSLLSFNHVKTDVFRTYALNLAVKIFENFHKYFDSENLAIDFSAISVIVNSKSELEIREAIVGYIDHVCATIEKSKSDERLELIREATTFLKENYAKPYLDLSTVADALHVSTSYISKEFKRVKGKTVIEFLTDLRMDKAKELLKNTNLKVFEISMQVGYDDPNYFSYNFRKHIGTSPLKYRKS